MFRSKAFSTKSDVRFSKRKIEKVAIYPRRLIFLSITNFFSIENQITYIMIVIYQRTMVGLARKSKNKHFYYLQEGCLKKLFLIFYH